MYEDLPDLDRPRLRDIPAVLVWFLYYSLLVGVTEAIRTFKTLYQRRKQ